MLLRGQASALDLHLLNFDVKLIADHQHKIGHHCLESIAECRAMLAELIERLPPGQPDEFDPMSL